MTRGVGSGEQGHGFETVVGASGVGNWQSEVDREMQRTE